MNVNLESDIFKTALLEGLMSSKSLGFNMDNEYEIKNMLPYLEGFIIGTIDFDNKNGGFRCRDCGDTEFGIYNEKTNTLYCKSCGKFHN